MNTKMVDKIILEKQQIHDDILNSWQNFLDNKPTTDSFFSSTLESIFKKVEPLMEERWVTMKDEFLYDHKIKACWLYEYKEDDNGNEYLDLKFGNNYNSSYVEEIKNELKKFKKKNNSIDIPTRNELVDSLAMLNKAPFPVDTGSAYNVPLSINQALWKSRDNIQSKF